MKKIILSITLLILNIESYSQCFEDSVIIYSSTKNPIYKVANFSSNNRIDSSITFSFMTSLKSWNKRSTIKYFYNSNNELIEKLRFNSIIATAKTIYKKNKFGKDSIEFEIDLTSSDTIKKILYTYNNSNQNTNIITLKLDLNTSTYINSTNIINSYDNFNNLISKEFYEWNSKDNIWEKTYKNIYLYENNKIKTDSSFYGRTNQFVFSKSFDYFYDEKNNDTLIIQKDSLGLVKSKYIRVFNSNNCIKSVFYYSFNSQNENYEQKYFYNGDLSNSKNVFIDYFITPNPAISQINFLNYYGKYSIIDIYSGKEILNGEIIQNNTSVDISFLDCGVSLIKTNYNIHKLIKN